LDTASTQRKFKRVRYQLPVGCLLPYEVFQGRTSNLSEDGACLEIDRPLPLDSILSLIIRLPTRPKPVVVCSRVMWQNGNQDSTRCGLQYLWLPQEDRYDIRQFLEFLKGEDEPEYVRKGAPPPLADEEHSSDH
jgi:type IV pilus assembly protein PilZ